MSNSRINNKNTSQRSKKGNRLAALLQDEIRKQQQAQGVTNTRSFSDLFMEEGDKEYYSQKFFDEEEGDEDFEVDENKLQEEQDVIDEDFDIDETDQQNDKQITETDVQKQEKEERRKQSKKRAGAYVDPALMKKKQQKKIADGATPASRKRKREEAPKAAADSAQPAEKRAKRQSTIEKSKEVQEKLDQYTSRSASRKSTTSESRGRKKRSSELSQEQHLKEAEETAKRNTESLKQLIAWEEESKKNVAKKFQKNHTFDEPTTIFYSKDGKDFLINRVPPPKPARSHQKKSTIPAGLTPKNSSKSHKKMKGVVIIEGSSSSSEEENEKDTKAPKLIIENDNSSTNTPGRPRRPQNKQPQKNSLLAPPSEQLSQPI